MARILQIKNSKLLFYCLIPVIIIPLIIFLHPAWAATSGFTTSDTGAGYSTQPGPYTKAKMYFTVPRLQPTQSETTAVHIWTGLQRSDATHLVQTGILASITPQGIQTNYAWWMDYGVDPSFTFFSMNVDAGDHIWAYVSSNADNDGYNFYEIADLSKNIVRTHYEYNPNGFIGNAQAMCAIERVARAIADFGTISVRDCGTYINGQGSMHAIGNFPNNRMDMAAGGTTELVYTTALVNAANFSLEWRNSGIGLP